MKRLQYYALVAVVLGAFIVPTLVQAQMWSGRMGDRMVAQLELTEDQQTQLEDAQNSYTKDMIQLQADLRVARMDLQDLLESGAGQAALNKQVRVVSDAQTAILEANVALYVQIHEILGDETYQEWMDSHRGGWNASAPMMLDGQWRMNSRSPRGR